MKNSEETKKVHEKKHGETEHASKHMASKSHGCGCGYCGATVYEEDDFILEDENKY